MTYPAPYAIMQDLETATGVVTRIQNKVGSAIDQSKWGGIVAAHPHIRTGRAKITRPL